MALRGASDLDSPEQSPRLREVFDKMVRITGKLRSIEGRLDGEEASLSGGSGPPRRGNRRRADLSIETLDEVIARER